MEQIPTSQRNDFIVNVKELDLSFGDLCVFEDLELKVKRGSKIGIYGPSGCGKTSLLLILANKLSYNKGFLNNSKYKSRMIFQFPLLNPYLTCKEILEMEKTINSTNLDINAYLEKASLLNQKDRLVIHLSGGEKQRLSLICALMSGSDLVLADEPFGRLDSKNASRSRSFFIDMIDKEKKTLILASHYLNHFEGFNTIYEIKGKKLVKKSISTNI